MYRNALLLVPLEYARQARSSVLVDGSLEVNLDGSLNHALDSVLGQNDHLQLLCVRMSEGEKAKGGPQEVSQDVGQHESKKVHKPL